MTSPVRIIRALVALLAMTFALAACGASTDRIGVASLAASSGGGGMTERVFLVTSRKPVNDRNMLFSGERSGALHYGAIDVSVPGKRKAGEIEFPGRKPDLSKQFAATAIALSDNEDLFAERLRQEVASWPAGRRTIFIYVHGYNTSFASGLFRTAQLAHDYDVAGVTLHYSWPSANNAAMYLYDRDSADFARTGLVRTLRVAAAAEPESIVLIAHSMGGSIAMEALRELSLAGAGNVVRSIEALVLASPDIDADLFQADLAALTARPGVIAVIASSRDRALQLSSGIRGGEVRVGTPADAERLRAQGVVVIDASNLKDSGDPSGHHAFANAPALMRLLRGSDLSIASLAGAGRATSAAEGIGREGGELTAIAKLKKKVLGED